MALRTHCGLLIVLLMERCSIRGYVMQCGTYWATVLLIVAGWRHDPDLAVWGMLVMVVSGTVGYGCRPPPYRIFVRWTGPAVMHAWWCAALADRILRAEAVAAQPPRGKTWELRSPTGGRNFLGKSMEIANRVGVATECIYKFSINFGSFCEAIRKESGTLRANAIERLRFRLRFYRVKVLVFS